MYILVIFISKVQQQQKTKTDYVFCTCSLMGHKTELCGLYKLYKYRDLT